MKSLGIVHSEFMIYHDMGRRLKNIRNIPQEVIKKSGMLI